MEGLENLFKKNLSKFKFEEFPPMLACVFGNLLPWKSVTRQLDALRLDRRAKTVAEVCCMLYKMTRPAREDALKTLWLLQLHDVAVHSNRKWFGIKLKEPFPDSRPTLENIEKNLSRAYRTELKKATVYRTVVDGCHYIMAIEEISTKKGPKFRPPVFFVYNTNLKQPFAFYTPKLSKMHPLYCFSSAIGYQDYRLLALSGENVEKLFEAVQRKRTGTVALRAPSLDSVPVTRGHVTDMTRYSSRRKYAMNALPGGIQMKTFTVKSENEWRGTSIIPELKRRDCMIESSLTIQTKNGISVEGVLQEMIARGDIKTPLPSWLSEISQQPRNTIKLRAAVPNSSGGAFERTDDTENSERDEDDDFFHE